MLPVHQTEVIPAHIEEAGSLSLWHTVLNSSDYLVAQVFGIRFHASMIAHRSITMTVTIAYSQRMEA